LMQEFNCVKRVIVTPAVYLRLVEFLHFDIQSTGQKSHRVNTDQRPSRCFVLIRQSCSQSPRQFCAVRLGRTKPTPARESRRRRKPRPSTEARRRRSERARARPVQPTRAPLLDATRSSPHLRANPYPEVTDRICRLPLPTLFYRPEAVHLGDLLRIRVRPGVKITLPPSDFQGPTPMHRTPREARRFTDATSLSLDKPIPGSPLLTKKRELFPGSTLASPSSVALPHWGPRAQSPPPGSGILTRFPFDRFGASKVVRPFRRPRVGSAALSACMSAGAAAHVRRLATNASSPFRTEFSDLLGPTDPCPTAVHMEPFSTSVYKVLICILATTTKICTEGGSTRALAQRFNATDTPSYSSGPGITHALPRRCGMGRTLQRHPFSGLVDSAGELLHTP